MEVRAAAYLDPVGSRWTKRAWMLLQFVRSEITESDT
jgi:hypothetical protein